jgi:hypothetical protein
LGFWCGLVGRSGNASAVFSRHAHIGKTSLRRPDATGVTSSRTASALELLASCDNGCPEGILHAHGFAINDMVELEPTREAAMAALAKSWRRD